MKFRGIISFVVITAVAAAVSISFVPADDAAFEYYDIGGFHQKVSTDSAEAQLWFDCAASQEPKGSDNEPFLQMPANPIAEIRFRMFRIYRETPRFQGSQSF